MGNCFEIVLSLLDVFRHNCSTLKADSCADKDKVHCGGSTQI